MAHSPNFPLGSLENVLKQKEEGQPDLLYRLKEPASSSPLGVSLTSFAHLPTPSHLTSHSYAVLSKVFGLSIGFFPISKRGLLVRPCLSQVNESAAEDDDIPHTLSQVIHLFVLVKICSSPG